MFPAFFNTVYTEDDSYGSYNKENCGKKRGFKGNRGQGA